MPKPTRCQTEHFWSAWWLTKTHAKRRCYHCAIEESIRRIRP